MDRDVPGKPGTRYAKRAEPVSLTLEELDFEHYPVTRVVPAVPVSWSDGGIRRMTWVWASAVRRRTDPVGKTALGDRTGK